MSLVQLIQVAILLIVLLIVWLTKRRIDARINSFAESIGRNVISYIEKTESERNIRLDTLLKRMEDVLIAMQKKD